MLQPRLLLHLDEEQHEIQRVARDFAHREIAPFAARWDRDRHFERSVVDRINLLITFAAFSRGYRARISATTPDTIAADSLVPSPVLKPVLWMLRAPTLTSTWIFRTQLAQLRRSLRP